jgi:hypothetical protein
VSKPDLRPMSVVELFGLTLPSSSSRIATGTDAGATAGTTASCFAKPAELAPHYFEASASSMWYAASWNQSPLGTACTGDVSGGPWAYTHPMYPSQWPCAGHVSNSQSPLSYPAPAQPAAAVLRMFGSELNENTVNMRVCNRFVGTLPPSADDHDELSAKDHEELLRNARPENYED